MTQVRDIMHKNVITIEYDKTALDAATMLKEKEISFLVIIKEGKPYGIVSERDIVRKIASEDLVASTIPLEKIMSKKYRWVMPGTMIEDAVQKMLNSNIRRLARSLSPKWTWIGRKTRPSDLWRESEALPGVSPRLSWQVSRIPIRPWCGLPQHTATRCRNALPRCREGTGRCDSLGHYLVRRHGYQ